MQSLLQGLKNVRRKSASDLPIEKKLENCDSFCLGKNGVTVEGVQALVDRGRVKLDGELKQGNLFMKDPDPINHQLTFVDTPAFFGQLVDRLARVAKSLGAKSSTIEVCVETCQSKELNVLIHEQFARSTLGFVGKTMNSKTFYSRGTDTFSNAGVPYGDVENDLWVTKCKLQARVRDLYLELAEYAKDGVSPEGTRSLDRRIAFVSRQSAEGHLYLEAMDAGGTAGLSYETSLCFVVEIKMEFWPVELLKHFKDRKLLEQVALNSLWAPTTNILSEIRERYDASLEGWFSYVGSFVKTPAETDPDKCPIQIFFVGPRKGGKTSWMYWTEVLKSIDGKYPSPPESLRVPFQDAGGSKVEKSSVQEPSKAPFRYHAIEVPGVIGESADFDPKNPLHIVVAVVPADELWSKGCSNVDAIKDFKTLPHSDHIAAVFVTKPDTILSSEKPEDGAQLRAELSEIMNSDFLEEGFQEHCDSYQRLVCPGRPVYGVYLPLAGFPYGKKETDHMHRRNLFALNDVLRLVAQRLRQRKTVGVLKL